MRQWAEAVPVWVHQVPQGGPPGAYNRSGCKNGRNRGFAADILGNILAWGTLRSYVSDVRKSVDNNKVKAAGFGVGLSGGAGITVDGGGAGNAEGTWVRGDLAVGVANGEVDQAGALPEGHAANESYTVGNRDSRYLITVYKCICPDVGQISGKRQFRQCPGMRRPPVVRKNMSVLAVNTCLQL